MADAGTSADQDRRFSDKEVKLLKSMKFPSEFDKKVDMRKVNLTVIRPWIAKKIIDLVGFEDEVVVEYAMGLLEDESQPMPDPRKMQINLTGFLTKDTPEFMKSLWKLLIEAQEDITGVPRTFVEQKKEEMRKARETDSRAIDERDRRATVRLDEIQYGDRGRGGGRVPRASPGRKRRHRSPSQESQTPPRRAQLSRSRSRSPPPNRRRRPRYREKGGRDSRSPPPRKRRISPRFVTPSRSASPRRSRSRSPPTNDKFSKRPQRSVSRSRSPHGRAPRRSRSPGAPPRRRRRSPSYSPPRRGGRTDGDKLLHEVVLVAEEMVPGDERP
ncbi:PWI domain-containing protein [Crepidotus variabilis]|uniref:PWI domain-containing protein n=1 Tax=Crepidotus variabilis TaxID=179855 RepID=A0A9P6JLP8_9AGAR|nr:PWI domain-containing protein [Crepidotus variabilis]